MVVEVSNHILAGEMYKALKSAKTLIAYEKDCSTMQHAATAYGKIAKQTASPRELEADLLLSAAARLQAIRDGWDDKRPELDSALLYNRKLWSVFVDLGDEPGKSAAGADPPERRQSRPLRFQPDADHHDQPAAGTARRR